MEDQFLIEIQDTFLNEAQENLNQIESLFIALEKGDVGFSDAFDRLKRLAHNFKGSAKAVGFDNLSEFCHSFENLLIGFNQNSIKPSSKSIDLLLRCNDALRLEVESLMLDKKSKTDFSGLIIEIESSVDGNLEEVEILRGETKINEHNIQARQKDESIRVPMKRIEDLFNAFGEQVILMSTLDHLRENAVDNKEEIEKTILSLKNITSNLQQSTLSLRMVTMRTLFGKLERAIRDVSRMTGKFVRCELVGIDQELDKSIVDQISDALTHMVRNSVDHGLELPSERQAIGKSEEGVVGIKAIREAGNFVIEIYDDGKGLDPQKIKAKAIQNKLIPEGRNISESEIYELIFENGFSTKESVSEISGRGVGMNVVKEVIKSLNGSYEIFSSPGKGTRFRIKLPLSLSLFNGLCFMSNGRRYIVPSSQVQEIIDIQEIQIRQVEKNITVVQIREEIRKLHDLKKILTLGRKVEDLSDLKLKRDMVMTANFDGEKMCFQVEKMLGILRVVQKPLTDEAQRCPGAVGVTILGDGSPSIILDLRSLLNDLKNAKLEAA